MSDGRCAWWPGLAGFARLREGRLGEQGAAGQGSDANCRVADVPRLGGCVLGCRGRANGPALGFRLDRRQVVSRRSEGGMGRLDSTRRGSQQEANGMNAWQRAPRMSIATGTNGYPRDETDRPWKPIAMARGEEGGGCEEGEARRSVKDWQRELRSRLAMRTSGRLDQIHSVWAGENSFS